MTPTSHAGAFGGQGVGLIVGLIAAVAILFLRNRRARALRIERLWIRPVMFIVIVAATLIAAPPPPSGINIALLGSALVIGAALGWQRGRFMRIDVDAETHALTSQASPIGLIFILALLALRMGMRGALTGSREIAHVSAVAAADALIMLAGAMMVTQGLEMWLRARGLLAQARALNP